MEPLNLALWDVRQHDDRFVIPVYSPFGTPVFTVTRWLNREPKYVFEPRECRRGAVLYGLHRAASAIMRERRAVLVEGFSDVICCHLDGVSETVGVLGSGVTRTQESLLACLADTVVLLLDGDAAGEGTARGSAERLTSLTAIGVTIDGVDPSEFRAQGGDLGKIADLAFQLAPAYSYVRLSRTADPLEMIERGT